MASVVAVAGWASVAAVLAAVAYQVLLAPRSKAPQPLSVPSRLLFDPTTRLRKKMHDVSSSVIADFAHTAEAPVQRFDEFFKASAAHLSPYCFDHASGRVILVNVGVKDAADETDVTFFYQGQRKHATEAYAVPVDDFARVVAALSPIQTDATLVFLHSVGRCGSTLLTKLFESHGESVALQEPDVYTSAVSAATKNLVTEETLHKLLKATSDLLMWGATHDFPAAHMVIVKPRSYCIHIAEAMSHGLQRAKNAFLYRGALKTVDSFGAAFGSGMVFGALNKLGLRSIHWAIMHRLFGDFAPVFAPLLKDKERFPEELSQYGLAGFLTLGWLSAMEKAFQLHDHKQLDSLLRYEDLVASPLSVTTTFLEQLNIPIHVDQKMVDQVFSKDAHVSGITVSTRRKMKTEGLTYLLESEIPWVNELIGRMPHLAAEDVTLPGSITASNK